MAFDYGGPTGAPNIFNVKEYGAKGDLRAVTDGAITNGLAILTSASAVFTAADVGKLVSVVGAGVAAATLNTTISVFTNATTVTLAATASATVTGATTNVATDDASAIQAAITGADGKGPVFFPEGAYKIATALSLPKGTRLEGTYRLGLLYGTVLQGHGSVNLLQFAYPSITFDGGTAAVSIEGFHFVGGVDQLYMPNGGTFVTVRDCTFDGPSHAGIYCRSFVQDCLFDRLEFSGGQYGFYYPYETGANGGSSQLFDKNVFRAIRCVYQAINGFLVSIKLSNNILFEYLQLAGITQDAFVYGGTIRDWTFINVDTEVNGATTPTAHIAEVTGTGTTGTPTLVVSSSTGYVNGDTVTIQNGGAGITDLVTTISSGGGTTTWTLATNLLTTVTATDVTKYIYSDFKSISNAAPSGGPANMTLINYKCLSVGTGGQRYSLDLTNQAGPFVLLSSSGGARPIYDPNGKLSTFGSGGIRIRRPDNFSNWEKFTTNTFDGSFADTPRAQLVSVPGRPLVFALQDSNSNPDAAGTVSNFEFRRGDSGRTRIAWIDGNLWNMTLRGGIATNNGTNRIIQGTGAPTSPGPGSPNPVAGDLYIRLDTQQLYVCTTGGASPVWALGTKQAPAFAASFTPDPTAGQLVSIGALTANITVNNVASPVNGQSMTLVFTQDGTGGRTVTWGAAYKVNWIPSTAASAKNSITFVYDGTNWIQTSVATGL